MSYIKHIQSIYRRNKRQRNSKESQSRLLLSMQNHMACTDAQFCDFVVYCPFVENPIHIVRITRDEEAIELIYKRVQEAEIVIQDNLSQLNNTQRA